MDNTLLLIAIIVILFFAAYMMFRIRKSDNQFNKFRNHACDIAGIRTPDDWLAKRKVLNVLMKDRMFMDYGYGRYYYTLDEMMDRKLDSIMVDVEAIAKAHKEQNSGK